MTYATAGLISYLSISYLLAQHSELLFRDSKSELLPTITDIINASLRSSEVPTSMKSALCLKKLP